MSASMRPEDEFIAALHARLGRGREGAGAIGDDGVLLLPEDGRVVVVDAMVEGVHFDLRWSSLSDVAFKALAVNASDVWAMGAEPSAWLLTVGLGPEAGACAASGTTLRTQASALADGFADAIKALDLDIALVGGDTVRAAPGATFLSITMFGRLEGAPLTRGGARPGDLLWVDGPLGFAAAGLHALQRGREREERFEPFIRAHRRPTPRRLHASEGRRTGISAALDVSDGLARDALRLAQASGVQVHLEMGQAVAPALSDAARLLDGDALKWALHGGDDYVKLVASPRAPGSGWTRVGEVEDGPPSLTLSGPDGSRKPLIPAGFEHFDD